MFAKHTKGSGFRGVCDYLLGPGKSNQPDRAQIIGGNMASGDARGLASEFSQIDRGHAKKPVLHISLNAAPGEHLSDEKWQLVAHDYMHKHGIDPNNHQHVIVRHSDRDHDHVHLVINRVGLDGELTREKRGDFELARKYCREIEKEHGLQDGEQRLQADKGLVSEMKVKVTAARDASKGKGFAEFKARLEKDGIKTIEFRHQSGKLNGLAFQAQGHARVKAGDLGDEFRTKNLMSELSPTTPTMSRTTTPAKTAVKAAGKGLTGALKQMPKMPNLPRMPGLPGAGGLAGHIGRGLAAGMQSAVKSVQQQASKQQKRRDHELE